MAMVENRPRGTGEDEAAITELHEIVGRQRQAFLAEPYPSLQERQALLGALAGMLLEPPHADRGGDEQRLRRASRG